MPTTSVSKQCTTALQTYVLTLPVERGRLKAVSVSQIEGTSVPGQLFTMVALAQQPASPTTIVASLCSGPFTVYQPIGWDGDIPLEPNMTIYARFKAKADVTIKLSALVELD